MDADGRMIPLVEDDQGEGIKDFMDVPIKKKPTIAELEAILDGGKQSIEILPNGEIRAKGKTENEMLEIINNKLDRLLEVFGDYRLVNGKFVDISKALPYNSISTRGS